MKLLLVVIFFGSLFLIPGCDHPDERPPEVGSVFLYLEDGFHNWYDIEKPVTIKPTHIIFTDINGERVVWSGDYLITTEGIADGDVLSQFDKEVALEYLDQLGQAILPVIKPEKSKIWITTIDGSPDKPVNVKTKNGSTKVQFMRPNLPRGD